MTWQNNLFSNILTIAILLALGIIIYCKVKNVTLIELIKQVKETTSPNE